MKKQSFLLILMLLLAACVSTEQAGVADESSGEEMAVTAEIASEETAEEAMGEPETMADSEEHGEDHGDDTHTHTHADGVDLSLFYDGALAEDRRVSPTMKPLAGCGSTVKTAM